MFAAAAAAGVTMTLASGYRSFSTQTATYNGYVNARGTGRGGHRLRPAGLLGAPDRLVLRHRRRRRGGTASSPAFADQPAAVWAKANAHRFGFVVRYPWMLHEITGYYYEPWHLRYIGVEAAGEMNTRGIATLEEYFGLEAAPAYR